MNRFMFFIQRTDRFEGITPPKGSVLGDDSIGKGSTGGRVLESVRLTSRNPVALNKGVRI
jgi:hypothetical protein